MSKPLFTSAVMDNYCVQGTSYRSVTAGATLARLLPLLSYFGITRLANTTGLDRLGVSVVAAIRPNSKSLSVSQGKGLQLEQAKVSAIMESIELWHAENIVKPQIVSNYQRIHTQAISPANFYHHRYQFDLLIDKQIAWLEAEDYFTQQICYIPYELINLDTTQPTLEQLLIATSSTGLASGNTLIEAESHGLYEIVERYQVALWLQLSAEEQNKRLLKLNSIQEPRLRELIERVHEVGLSLCVWDISQHDVPVYYCILYDHDIMRGMQMFSGSAAHYDKDSALLKAICEAAQVRLTYIAGARDDIFPGFFKQLRLSPSELPIGDYDYRQREPLEGLSNISQQRDFILSLLLDKGYQQVLKVNHTRDEFNIPVVHSIIPGMIVHEH